MLPSNHVIGTVKVLDRAFTLELTEADCSTYLLPVAETQETNLVNLAQLLARFTGAGEFTGCSSPAKTELAAYLVAHPEVRASMQTRNQLLRPAGLHFGYRVFDEIIWFLYWA